MLDTEQARSYNTYYDKMTLKIGRLEMLARVMRDVISQEKRFDLSTYGMLDRHFLEVHDQEVIYGCILCYAAQDEEFQSQGWHISPPQDRDDEMDLWYSIYNPKTMESDHYCTYRAGVKFFDMTEDEATDMFLKGGTTVTAEQALQRVLDYQALTRQELAMATDL